MSDTLKVEHCTDTCPDRRRHDLRCGCGGNHKMLPFQEWWVHFGGEHWVLDCLTYHLLRQNQKDQDVARSSLVSMYRKLKDLRAQIALLDCSKCRREAGRNFVFFGKALYCQLCWKDLRMDIGGEG